MDLVPERKGPCFIRHLGEKETLPSLGPERSDPARGGSGRTVPIPGEIRSQQATERAPELGTVERSPLNA